MKREILKNQVCLTMIDVRETLERLRDAKRENKIVPDGVLFTDLHNEIMRQVKMELNELYSEGKISVSTTLNDKSITLL